MSSADTELQKTLAAIDAALQTLNVVRVREILENYLKAAEPYPIIQRKIYLKLDAASQFCWRIGFIDQSLFLSKLTPPPLGLTRYVTSFHYTDACTPDALLSLRRSLAASYRHVPPLPRAPIIRAIPSNRPLRVGHFVRDRASSANFFFDTETRNHDKSKIATHCIYFDEFIKMHGGGDDLDSAIKIFDCIAELEIDILVDHCDIMGGGMPMLMMAQPAPMILGRGGLSTSALPSIAWRLGDAVSHPSGCEPYWTERILRVPQMQCYAPPPTAPKPRWRADGPPIFGAFCQAGKIQPRTARVWAQLLAAQPDAQLLVKHRDFAHPLAQRRLLQLLADAGAPMARVSVIGDTSHADHLAAYGRVDIVLDPFPFGGHTTLCEALWMGTPAVALLGETLPGRWSASYLTGAGCGDWIAHDEQDYIAKALALVADRSALNARRQGLRDHVAASRLCDGAAWARAMEAGYQHMVDAHNAAR